MAVAPANTVQALAPTHTNALLGILFPGRHPWSWQAPPFRCIRRFWSLAWLGDTLDHHPFAVCASCVKAIFLPTIAATRLTQHTSTPSASANARTIGTLPSQHYGPHVRLRATLPVAKPSLRLLRDDDRRGVHSCTFRLRGSYLSQALRTSGTISGDGDNTTSLTPSRHFLKE
ncbi:hypothetical protein HMN09_00991800 [Mycena chlorophos]|uniref:Uncharacterized protein n=1 Tax=Mycena chlorophos TaxID=658473 RepID=A0A8H6SHS2_MYCCL|nr:hypothetical protein HMN09_00991800 [Mycena chlorophos]